MDVDGEALFSQPLMGHPVFTVFVNWTLARAGNTQRLKQLGGEDVLGMGILAPGCIQPRPGGSGGQGSQRGPLGGLGKQLNIRLLTCEVEIPAPAAENVKRK